jgi:hypothetical protein
VKNYPAFLRRINAIVTTTTIPRTILSTLKSDRGDTAFVVEKTEGIIEEIEAFKNISSVTRKAYKELSEFLEKSKDLL